MRLVPVTPGTRPELAGLEQRILVERGRISPLYQVLLNSPAMAQGWEQLLSAVRNRSGLPPRLRELVILRVAVLNEAAYEFDAHVPHALAAGATQDTVAAMRGVPLAPDAPLDPRERAALALTDAMTREIRVADDLFEAVRAHFDAQGLTELLVTIAAYNMVSRFLVAAQIGH